MHDEYEDSPYSDTCRVEMTSTGISSVLQENAEDRAEIYSLNGVLQAVSQEGAKTLPKGVYIMRKGKETKKIIVD